MKFGKTPVSTDPAAIANIVGRGVEDIFVKESLEARLRSGKRLRVKLGFDPTSPAVHIGRAISLRKLKEFQDLGHTAVFIVGDFTARIGDPSDKLSKRPMLTEAEIKNNLKTYKEQIGKIIDLKKAEFHFNSKWLSRLTFAEIAELAESFSVQQMIARRNFKERYDKGEEISLREFLYPLMQGYDSVAVKADVELGGFDQLFNVKAGRVIQRFYGMPEQDVLTTQMLEGTDGRKMSSSWGNVISLTDAPHDMFGKVMAVRDELIEKYFRLCTNVSPGELAKIKERLAAGENPRDLKLELGRAIVALYHGPQAAQAAAEAFIGTFVEGALPPDAPEVRVTRGALLADVLVSSGLVASKSDFRRLIEEGAVSDFDTGAKISDPKFVLTNDVALKVGKRRFVKIKI